MLLYKQIRDRLIFSVKCLYSYQKVASLFADLFIHFADFMSILINNWISQLFYLASYLLLSHSGKCMLLS